MDSQLYNKLQTTAMNYMQSIRPTLAGSNNPNVEAILSNFDPNFLMDWGHKRFVSTTSTLQDQITGQEFVTHMSKMAQGLETWSIEVQQTIVDTKQRKVMVRGDFFMIPKGSGPVSERTVLNDIIFVFAMDENGEKLVSATEFIDPVASAEIGRLMAANKPDNA
ncbi:hypothetical protein AC578_10661 [Pseudocercospora eumusae]|uniref:SnoaL-like domain-containing protein n=1 Tax=Pseudocercospora eumusae TaxID=321146 RepID=A0A139HJ92_9PEZI|nr:hypothetical protein AC578_10661 [Pseudocercospora eumusae]